MLRERIFRNMMMDKLKGEVYEQCFVCGHTKARHDSTKFICDRCDSSQFINGSGGITVDTQIGESFYTADRDIRHFFAELAYWRGALGYD